MANVAQMIFQLNMSHKQKQNICLIKVNDIQITQIVKVKHEDVQDSDAKAEMKHEQQKM